VPGKVTFFELAPLVRGLRALVLKSRALRPADLLMPLEAKASDGVWTDGELKARVDDAVARLTTRRSALTALAGAASDLDTYARRATDELLTTARHGMPQTGTGEVHATIRDIYDAVEGKVTDLVARWTERAQRHDTLMATWPTLTTDADRFAMLRDAE